MTENIARWKRLTKRLVREDGTEWKPLDLPEMELPRGKFICILGPSGCGKTTFLGMLGLVDTEFDGDLTLNLAGKEHPFGELGPRERSRKSQALRQHIGFCFQDIRLRLDADAVANVVDPLIYLGRGNATSRERVAQEMLDLLDLPRGEDDQDRRRRVGTYSGGMQQRTGIARALAVGPELVCADEPTAHVDDEKADEIYRDLKDRTVSNGISVVVVTHDRVRAERYADIVVRITKKYDNDQEHEAALKSGEWPFDVALEEKEATQPAGAELPDRLPSGSLATRTHDMALEAVLEFRPLFKQVLYWLTAGPIRSFFGRQGGRAQRVTGEPSHLYLPLMVAIITFSLLSAVGFFFYCLKSGVMAFQQEVVNTLQVVRRVRVESPSSSDGTMVGIDIDDAIAYAEDNGVPVETATPNYEVMGWALTPFDRDYLSKNQRYTQIFIDYLAGRLLPIFGDDEGPRDQRLTMNLLEVNKGDPLAIDLGIAAENEAYVSGLAGGGLPGMYINPNELDWVKFGQFDDIPEVGDEVALLFGSVTRALPPEPLPAEPDATDEATEAGATGSMSTDGEEASTPAHKSRRLRKKPRRPERQPLCVKFKVAGYLAPKPPPIMFRQRIRGALYHASIPRDTFQTVLAWQYDPLADSSDVPANWICEGSTPLVDGLEYKKNQNLTPVAMSYDFYAESPREALDLMPVLERYAQDRGVKFDDVISEHEFIEMVATWQEVTEWVGTLLEVIPIAVGGILLWLVIQSILQRRREQLLLFVVMGAPPWQLQLQCFFISALIVIPGLCIGYALGSALPIAAIDAIAPLGLPPDLLNSIKEVSIGIHGALRIGVFALAFAALASIVVVRTITSANPADVFRGQ